VEYKDHAIQNINSLHGRVIATFDNEPGNANMFFKQFPKAMNFWVKTTWNPDDHADTSGLHVIPDFSK
jgi:hypothetical protein